MSIAPRAKTFKELIDDREGVELAFKKAAADAYETAIRFGTQIVNSYDGKVVYEDPVPLLAKIRAKIEETERRRALQ